MEAAVTGVYVGRIAAYKKPVRIGSYGIIN